MEPHRENTTQASGGQALGKLEEQKTFQMSSSTSVAPKGEVKPSLESETVDPAAVLRMKRNTKKKKKLLDMTVWLSQYT